VGEITSILKAMAEETRLRILRLLSMQELTVTELVESLSIPQSRISRHLAVLRNAGLVRTRREGNWIYYTFSAEKFPLEMQDLWEAIKGKLSEASFFPEDLEKLQKTITARAARSRVRFDEIIGRWGLINRQYVQDAISFLAAGQLLQPETVVVEIGTGKGESLEVLAGASGHVIGVDSSEKILAACRARIAEAGLDNVELRRGDVEQLPLADEECDVALATMVLHHVNRPDIGVKEMARVVRAGGKVVIIDLVEHGRPWAREAMADQWLGFSRRQIADWLEGAGLGNVSFLTSLIASPLEPPAETKLQAFIAVAVKPRKN